MQSGTTGINTIQFIINKKLEDHDTEGVLSNNGCLNWLKSSKFNS
jgi:hypothetical protein